jgi:hypothetical protein
MKMPESSFPFLFVVFTALLLAACSPREGGDEAGGTAYMVTFAEKDAVTDFSKTRMIVTPHYLRIDEGVANNDFVLFDRKDKLVYSVSAEDRSILVVQPHEITMAAPVKFAHRVDEEELKDSPPIEGNKVSRYVLFTNDLKCYDVFAAPGLLEDVRQALIEYQNALAGEHAVMTTMMPADLRNDCDLANNIFLPARDLEHGFPVRLLDMTGRERILEDYDRNYKPDPVLFKLPEGYKRFTAEEMRAGAGGGQ